MPIYTNSPPDDPRGHALTLMRVPANGSFSAIITSPDLIGCQTHWFGGRTVPCDSTQCKACEEGVPWRWHAYVSALLGGSRQHVLLEFTAQAAETLVNYRTAHETLRGCYIKAKRHRNRHNGRVLLHCEPHSLEGIALPDAANLPNVLSIIWNLPIS